MSHDQAAMQCFGTMISLETVPEVLVMSAMHMGEALLDCLCVFNDVGHQRQPCKTQGTTQPLVLLSLHVSVDTYVCKT